MSSREDYLEERVKELEEKLANLDTVAVEQRIKIRVQGVQINEANGVIGFYADKENWALERTGFTLCKVVNEDDLDDRATPHKTVYGGKRAREYKEKWGIE